MSAAIIYRSRFRAGKTQPLAGRRQALKVFWLEAAYAVLSEDADRIGFTYSGFALTSLPHKNTEAASWKREGHNLTLLLES